MNTTAEKGFFLFISGLRGKLCIMCSSQVQIKQESDSCSPCLANEPPESSNT